MWGLAWGANYRGWIARLEGDVARAGPLIEESLEQFRTIGDRLGSAWALVDLGRIALRQRDFTRAGTLLCESLSMLHNIGGKEAIAWCLEALGALELHKADGSAVHAASLLGSAEVLRECLGAPLPPIDRTDLERSTTMLRARLDRETLAQAWAQGRAMPLDDAIARALGHYPVPLDQEPGASS